MATFASTLALRKHKDNGNAMAVSGTESIAYISIITHQHCLQTGTVVHTPLAVLSHCCHELKPPIMVARECVRECVITLEDSSSRAVLAL